MKRKILAIVLSLTIAVAFMPTIAFAEPAEQPDEGQQVEQSDEGGSYYADKYQKLKQFIVDKVKEVNKKVQDFRDTTDFSDAIKVIDKADQLLQYVRDVIENNDGAFDDLAAKMDKALNDLEKKYKVVEWADAQGENIAATLDKFRDAIEDFRDGTIDVETFKDLVEFMNDELVETFEEIQAIAEESMINQINAFFAAADEWADNRGLTDENMAAFVELMNAVTDILEKYKDMEPSDIIEPLIEKVETKLAEMKEKVDTAIKEQINKFIEKAQDWKQMGEDQFRALVAQALALKEVIEDYIDAIDTEAIKEEIKGKIEDAMDKIAEIKGAAEDAIKAEIEDFLAKAEDWKDMAEDQFRALVGQALALEELIEEYIADIDTEAIKEEIKEKIAEAMDQIEAIKEAAEDAIRAEIEEFLAEAENWKDMAKDKFWALVDKAHELEDAIKEYMEAIDTDAIKEKIAEAMAVIVAIKAAAAIALKEKAEKFIADVKALADKAKEWAADKGLTPEAAKALIEKAKELAEILKEYMIIDAPEKIRDLIEEAKAAFKQFEEAALDKLMATAMKALEMLESGELDPLLEMLGLDPAEVEDMLWDLIFKTMDIVERIKDAIAYFESGESFLDLKDQVEELNAQVEDLEETLDYVIAQNEKLEKVNSNLKKKLNNAAKLKKSKVVNKKPVKKGKKVYAKWKKFTKATINGYKVKYKVGKKAWKTKTVKNKKAVKKLIVKFKKGKKTKTVKVKVRAYYKMKAYNLTQTFYSKWSKVKKIKVKKVK